MAHRPRRWRDSAIHGPENGRYGDGAGGSNTSVPLKKKLGVGYIVHIVCWAGFADTLSSPSIKNFSGILVDIGPKICYIIKYYHRFSLGGTKDDRDSISNHAGPN